MSKELIKKVLRMIGLLITLISEIIQGVIKSVRFWNNLIDLPIFIL